MKIDGKFILFSIAEFDEYLKSTNFKRKITLIQNHHTYLPGYAQFNGGNHFQMVKGMEAFHKKNGFAEIAQNITTFPDGTIMICRSFDRVPAGIKGANETGICIEHIGNFDIGGDQMSKEHETAIIAVNALLCREFNLTPSTDSIVYHHWYDLVSGKRTNGTGSVKTCPGTNFFGGNSIEKAKENFITKIEKYHV